MKSDWIKQEENSLLEYHGSTILVKFKDSMYGITIDDGSSVEISWSRVGSDIITSSGLFKVTDIKEWKIVI